MSKILRRCFQSHTHSASEVDILLYSSSPPPCLKNEKSSKPANQSFKYLFYIETISCLLNPLLTSHLPTSRFSPGQLCQPSPSHLYHPFHSHVESTSTHHSSPNQSLYTELHRRQYLLSRRFYHLRLLSQSWFQCFLFSLLRIVLRHQFGPWDKI